jgi:hypothetical protein
MLKFEDIVNGKSVLTAEEWKVLGQEYSMSAGVVHEAQVWGVVPTDVLIFHRDKLHQIKNRIEKSQYTAKKSKFQLIVGGKDAR